MACAIPQSGHKQLGVFLDVLFVYLPNFHVVITTSDYRCRLLVTEVEIVISKIT